MTFKGTVETTNRYLFILEFDSIWVTNLVIKAGPSRVKTANTVTSTISSLRLTTLGLTELHN